MKTSITFLKSNLDFYQTIKLIDETSTEFIHVDVIDGVFANNVTPFDSIKIEVLKLSKKMKDVHLMTLNLKKYIDIFSDIEPYNITYQFEATTKHDEIIEYIKAKNCKVGIAISPLTDLEKIKPYLNRIDIVLVMGVIPGYGGQKFIESTPERVVELDKIRKDINADFQISVDGGIGADTLKKFRDCLPDIAVSGSYVCCSSNYEEKIQNMKNVK